jgi:hypothetical protein
VENLSFGLAKAFKIDCGPRIQSAGSVDVALARRSASSQLGLFLPLMILLMVAPLVRTLFANLI